MNTCQNLSVLPLGAAQLKPLVVSEDILQAIFATAHRAPLSMNAAFLSIIVVHDHARRARIAQESIAHDIVEAPIFVCVVADFAKASLILESEDEAAWFFKSQQGLATIAVDAGILLADLVASCNRLNIETLLINGIRLNLQALISVLELPPMTIPIAGCCIGIASKQSIQRPVLSIDTFRHNECWQRAPNEGEINLYNRAVEAYMEQS